MLVGDAHSEAGVGETSEGVGLVGRDIAVGESKQEARRESVRRRGEGCAGPGSPSARLVEGTAKGVGEGLIAHLLADMAEAGESAIGAVAVGGKETDGGEHERKGIVRGEPVFEEHGGARHGPEGAAGRDAKAPLPRAAQGDESQVVDPGLGAGVGAGGERDLELAREGPDAGGLFEDRLGVARQGCEVGGVGPRAGARAEGDVSRRVAAGADGGEAGVGEGVLELGNRVGGEVMEFDVLAGGQMERRAGGESAGGVREGPPLVGVQPSAEEFGSLHPESFLPLGIESEEPGPGGVGGDGVAGEAGALHQMPAPSTSLRGLVLRPHSPPHFDESIHRPARSLLPETRRVHGAQPSDR